MKKEPKKIYKKWWFWVIIVLLGFGVIGAITNPVTTEQKTETVSIPCEKKQQDDPTLAKGETKISQECVNGEKEIIYEVKMQSGEEISRKQVSESVKKVAVDEITLIGTKEEGLEPSANESTSTSTVNNNSSSDNSSGSSSQNNSSPNSGVTTTVSGYCNDGTYVTGDPSAKGKANACYGHRGWRDY